MDIERAYKLSCILDILWKTVDFGLTGEEFYDKKELIKKLHRDLLVEINADEGKG